jgi:hypothetical protein
MLAFFMLLFTSFGMVNQDPSTRQVAELLGNSTFVFKGQVLKVRSTTMPESVAAMDRTVTVKVEEVILAPDTLDDFTGREITVLLLKADSVKAGEHTVFFTNGWFYGSSLAVREVGKTRIDQNKLVSAQVSDMKEKVEDQKVQARIAQADLVVVGTVSEIRPARDQVRTTRISEHEPDWWEAVIKVESVLKGQPSQRDVVVLYPHSIDVMWYGTPKFSKGQQGVFLLRKEQRSDFPINGFTAPNRLDFQPLRQVDRIKRLTGNIQ